MSTVNFIQGDILERDADIIVLPCSSKGHISRTAERHVKLYGLTLPKEKALGEIEVLRFPGGVTKLYVWAASVMNSQSDYATIRAIGQKLAHYANEHPSYPVIESPLLGTGRGGLDPLESGRALKEGFLEICLNNTVLNIFSQYTNTINQLNSESYESVIIANRDNKKEHISSKKRFAVALSFPGEYRALVSKVAAGLASIYSKEKILYDEYHRAEFARPNLDIHLQNLYKNESELIVVFICETYNAREWCGIEWRAIRELLNNKTNDDRIMFVKCGEGSVDGVFGTLDGHIDSATFSFRDIIIDIVNRHTALENTDSLKCINYIENGFTNEIKIVINGRIQDFIGKVIDIKHWVDHSPMISTVAGSLILSIKSNDFTKFIKFNDRFILSQNVWKIIGIDDTGNQAITVTCKKDLKGPYDDMESKIANKDYIK